MSSRRDAKFYERSLDCVHDIKDGAKLLVGGESIKFRN